MRALKILLIGTLLFFHLLPSSSFRKKSENEIQEWNYREGADKVNIQGIKSTTQILEKWGNGIFWQTKHSLLSHPCTLLPELSSLQPVSEAIDNLLKQVQSIKRRLQELNERLNGISRKLFPIRYRALKSQQHRAVLLRRLPLEQRRRYIWRTTQKN